MTSPTEETRIALYEMWDKLVEASIDHVVLMLPQTSPSPRFSGIPKPERPARIMQVFLEEQGGARYHQRYMLEVPGLIIKVKVQMMNRPMRFEVYGGESIARLLKEQM